MGGGMGGGIGGGMGGGMGGSMGGGMGGGPPGASPTPQPQLFIGRLPPNTQQRELEEVILPYGAVLLGTSCFV